MRNILQRVFKMPRISMQHFEYAQDFFNATQPSGVSRDSTPDGRHAQITFGPLSIRHFVVVP
jgi:hypothetical protein